MKNTPDPVIILCGGNINVSNLPIATSGSNAMIPVNGKPVIGWILDDLLQKKVQQVVIVTQAENEQLIDFVGWAFRGRLTVKFALLNIKGNILHSLQAGLSELPGAQSITVLLGDTLLHEPFPEAENCVLVSRDFDDPRNWCLAKTNTENVVIQYFDKQNITQEGLVALSGVYRFSDADYVLQCCTEALENGGRELSHMLALYGGKHKIRAVSTERWYDFGHMPHFLKAKRELLQSRYFNQLQVEPVRGIVRKTSSRTEKLRDEYEWYLKLPDALKVLTPRVLGWYETAGSVTLTQEYYGYPNLAELYLYSRFDAEIWQLTIRHLMQTHELLKAFPGEVSVSDARLMYRVKTEERLAELMREDTFFRELGTLERIRLNGEWLDNLPLLQNRIEAHCERLASSVQGSVIHGDFCLSNILYDINNQLVRLIDPRGRFGRKGIYGDPRYDMAKLRHSLDGSYDLMLADLFTVNSVEAGHFETAVCKPELYEDIARFFDAELSRAGYELRDIICIEALLFLSMIPLHKGKKERQLMMYLRAVKLFNTL